MHLFSRQCAMGKVAADSDPDTEYEEYVSKPLTLFREAVRFRRRLCPQGW